MGTDYRTSLNLNQIKSLNLIFQGGRLSVVRFVFPPPFIFYRELVSFVLKRSATKTMLLLTLN